MYNNETNSVMTDFILHEFEELRYSFKEFNDMRHNQFSSE
jgi:hypothetical protein